MSATGDAEIENKKRRVINRLLNNTGYKIGLIFLSRFMAALLGIALLPVYIRYLGTESYGLVAFYSTLASALSILDMGLSSSTSREIAILNAKKASALKKTSLLFSVEMLNWLIAIVAGLCIVFLSLFIAKSWIKAEYLHLHDIQVCVILMGIMFTVQFPSSVYEGTLNGLHRQGELALIILIFTIIKSVGVIFILEYVNNSIQSYFVWQLLIVFLLTFVLRFYSYKYLSAVRCKKYFSLTVLRSIKRFALGMTAASIVTFFISQMDKVVVSKYLYLEYVGYYNVAFLIAGALSMIAGPFLTILLPKLNTLQAEGKYSEFDALYYKSSKWIITVLAPVTFGMICFSHEMLLAWTKNPKLAAETAPVLQVVALGTFFNCIAGVFYYYTLGKGDTKYALYQNIIGVIIILPSIVLLTKYYGAFGAGCCWLIYNSLLLLVSLPVFHRIYLKRQLFKWVSRSFIPPVTTAFLIYFLAWLVLRKFDLNIWILGVFIVVLSMLYFFVIRDTRVIIKNVINMYILRRKDYN